VEGFYFAGTAVWVASPHLSTNILGMTLSRFNNIWLALFVLVLGGGASLRTIVSIDLLRGLEEGGGILTRPMIKLALLGSAILLSGVIIQLRRQGAALLICSLGFALMLPFFSWRFAAGLWCSVGTCHGEYPLFTFDGYSVISIIMAVSSISLQARQRYVSTVSERPLPTDSIG
jgi:hypothetical protein